MFLQLQLAQRLPSLYRNVKIRRTIKVQAVHLITGMQRMPPQCLLDFLPLVLCVSLHSKLFSYSRPWYTVDLWASKVASAV